MLLQCLECNYKYGNIACLKYRYESYNKDKTDKCMCDNIILIGICANDFSPWGCSLKNESSSNSSSNSNSNSNSNSISNPSSNPSSSSNPNSNSSSNPSSSSSSSSGSGSNPSSNSSSGSGSGSGSIYDYNSNSDPNPNPDPNLIPNPNPNLNPSSEVLTRCCNKCNYIKPLNNFDEGKYTCRSCTSAKVNCPYCTSVVRYDGIWAHVKKQHPDVEITRGFSRNITDRCNHFADKTINPSWQSPRAVSLLVISQTEDLRICKTTPLSSFTDSCSCKYYNFVSFPIINGINIEKVKENINLLKSIDNWK